MSEMNSGDNWERRLLEKVAMASLQEQRNRRRWGVVFKSLAAIYLFMLLFWGLGYIKRSDSDDDEKGLGKHTSVVVLKGVIQAGGEADADTVNKGLRAAFKDKDTQGVILRINSPGGSPVEAGRINDEIRRQRKLHPDIKLYVVVDDICASGGYYVAAAADAIYVDKASLVGSIGVIMDGFGFVDLMKKLGVERRALTAGENKAFLDPFQPVVPSQQQYAKDMLEQIHQQFITVVRTGRGTRLHETPDMFSGLIWTGEKSVEVGLADGLGNVDSVARDVIKADKVVDYTEEKGFAEKLARKFGATMAQSFMSTGGLH